MDSFQRNSQYPCQKKAWFLARSQYWKWDVSKEAVQRIRHFIFLLTLYLQIMRSTSHSYVLDWCEVSPLYTRGKLCPHLIPKYGKIIKWLKSTLSPATAEISLHLFKIKPSSKHWEKSLPPCISSFSKQLCFISIKIKSTGYLAWNTLIQSLMN